MRRLRRRWLALLAGLLLLVLIWGLLLPLAAPALLRWGLAQAEPWLAGHRLLFDDAHWAPWRLSLQVQGLRLQPPSGEPLLSLRSLELDLDAPGSLRHGALALDALRLQAPRLRVELLRTGSNWRPLLQALQAGAREPAADPAPPRLRIAQLRLHEGRLDYRDRSGAVERSSYLDALQLELQDLSTLPEARGNYQLVARTGAGGQLRWRGQLGLQPLRAEGVLEGDGLQLARLLALLPQAPLQLQAPGGRLGFGLHYRLSAEAGQPPQLAVQALRLQLDELTLQGLRAGAAALQLQQLRLEGGQLQWPQRQLQFAALRLQGGRLQAARDAAGRLNLLDWLPAPAASTENAPAGPRWQIGLTQLALQGLALQLDDAGFAEPQRLQLGALQLQLAAQLAVGGAEAPSLQLQQLRLQAEDLRVAALRSPESPWLQLPQLRLSDSQLDLAAPRLQLGALTLQGPRLALQRNAQGKLPLRAALQRRAVPDANADATDTEPAWQVETGPLQLRDASLLLDDASVQPAAGWQLQGLQADAENLVAARPRLVRAQAQLASGGRLRASGNLQPLDLRLQLDAVALSPLQPYLQPYLQPNAPLRLRDGRLSADARLRLAAERPADWRLDGSAELAALQLDDAAGPFFSWRRLQAPALRLSPRQLDLGTLRVDGLDAQLLIDRQRQLNWLALARRPDTRAGSAPAAAPPRITLRRLQLHDAELDFADLSLALPFAARIHGGEGEFVGLDTAPGSAPARLQFTGQVDEYGEASASGTLQPLAPTAYSDLRVAFRNVEMTRLTPYTATFAGRRIASGKLDLDLQYRLRDRQLEGDNRVVMTRLQLGEAVDSPGARSLPLDLAIALLEDSEGRIELGLPVRGSLDNPEFSYGGLVWQAIVNVLTQVATAPFRALAGLLGGEQAPADRILFAPGRAQMAPPEREKLLRLAQALAQRPGLALQLPAAFDAERDALALKTLQLQQALALQDDGEAASPPRLLDFAEPRTAAAIDRLARQRLGAQAERLAQRHAMAQPAPPPGLAQSLLDGARRLAGRAAEPLSEAERNAMRERPLAELQWQQLLAAEPLAPQALAQLGQARAEALAAELKRHGLPAERLLLAPPAALAADSERDSEAVALSLGAQPLAR